MKHFLELLKTSFTLELRVQETLALLFSLITMVAVIIALGINASFIDPSVKLKLYPGLLWILFIVSATVSVGRSFEYEIQHNAIDALLLYGISPALIYAAKTLSNFCLLFLGQVWALICLAVLTDVSIIDLFFPLLCIVSLVIIGYAALATLLAGITLGASLKQFLLPLILIPLLSPLFFAAVELSTQVMTLHRIDINSGWLSLLIGLDVLYVVLGLNLFQYVIRE